MENDKTAGLDMEAELFITDRRPFDYLVPPKPEAEYLRDLQEGSMAAKAIAMHAIVQIYRGKVGPSGVYTRELAACAPAVFKKFASGPELGKMASDWLFGEGSNCENCGDYQGAVWFFEASLQYENPDKEFCYFRLNNLAFNLLCLKKFKEAEGYLAKSIEIMPKRYNSWKNAGIAMEHQGKSELAAQAYMRAINLSNAEKRSVKHLMRLITRHPELRADAHVAGYLDSLAKHGLIPKESRAQRTGDRRLLIKDVPVCFCGRYDIATVFRRAKVIAADGVFFYFRVQVGRVPVDPVLFAVAEQKKGFV